jgi:transposase
MVTSEGLPIGYKVFEGDKYEGHTLIPMIKEIRQKHKINKVIIVSDAGMFGRNNLEELENLEGNGIEYIVGARLKNMPEDIKEEILDTSKYREISSGYKVMRLKYQGKERLI